jgi:hypothetical protein
MELLAAAQHPSLVGKPLPSFGGVPFSPGAFGSLVTTFLDADGPQMGSTGRRVDGFTPDLATGLHYFGNRLCPYANRAFLTLAEKGAVGKIDYVHIDLKAIKPVWYKVGLVTLVRVVMEWTALASQWRPVASPLSCCTRNAPRPPPCRHTLVSRSFPSKSDAHERHLTGVGATRASVDELCGLSGTQAAVVGSGLLSNGRSTSVPRVQFLVWWTRAQSCSNPASSWST